MTISVMKHSAVGPSTTPLDMWYGSAAKPRLRWRHRTEINGVKVGDWGVWRADERETAPPLLAAFDDGYRMAESDIARFFA